MDLNDAQLIADKFLEEMIEETGFDLCFNPEVVEEHDAGFVFFYNTRKYWETKDFSHSLAGNGPVLVRKPDGDLIQLPSHQSVSRSLAELGPNGATQR